MIFEGFQRQRLELPVGFLGGLCLWVFDLISGGDVVAGWREEMVIAVEMSAAGDFTFI